LDGRTRVALRFFEHHPDESARLLESLDARAAGALLAHAPPALAGDVLRRIVPSFGAECLAQLGAERAVGLVEALPVAIAAGLLRRLDAPLRDAVLAQLSPAGASALGRLLAHPADSAGGRMDPRIFTLPEDIRVADAVERLRTRSEYAMYYLYVVDREQRLTGVLNYRDLLLASDEATLRGVMRSPVVSLPAGARGDALLGEPAWRTYLALPVVDASGILLGVVRAESLRDLEWSRRAPAPAPASRLAGVWRGVSDLLGRGEGGRGGAGSGGSGR
jgi:magnesium transporter